MKNLLVIAAVATVAVVANKQSCYTCSGVARKEDCTRMTECARNEVCNTRLTVNSAGNVTFDLGCVSDSCSSMSSTGVIGRRKRSGDLTLCYQCCDSDAKGCTAQDSSQCGCNRDLCAIPHETHTKSCFSCNDVVHPSECTTTKFCYGDQMCSTREYSVQSSGEKRYRMGCEQKAVCNVFEMNSFPGSYCSRCCDTNFCNIALCGATRKGCLCIMRTLIALALLCAVAECTQLCYSCNGVPSQSDCGETTTCGPHEKCYTKRYTGPSGNLMFESGCMDKSICSIIDLNLGTGRKKRDLVNCLKCCDSEAMGCTEQNTTTCGCNADLCNRENDRGTKCFHCDDVIHPNECSELKACFEDRICYTRKVELDSNGEKRFSMGCEEKRVCNIFEQNALSTAEGAYCTRCCNESFCNMALCGIPKLVIPSFTRKPNDRKVADGDVINLHCEVDPRSNATITWTFQSSTVTSNVIPNTVHITQGGTRVQIRVTHATLGTWTCTATNPIGSTAAVAIVASAVPAGSTG